MSAKTVTKPKKTKTAKPEAVAAGRKAARAKNDPKPWYVHVFRFLLALIPGAAAYALLKYSESHRNFSEWFAMNVQPLWQG